MAICPQSLETRRNFLDVAMPLGPTTIEILEERSECDTSVG